MSFGLALVLVAAAGFVSLSYEILWYRVYSFTSQGSPASFGVVLGVYLLGIALGSLGSGRFCRERTADDRSILQPIALFVFLANLVGFVVVPLLGLIVTHGKWGASLPAVAVAAGLMGATFPLISHFGIAPDDRAGVRLSYLYMSNIAGSAAGSLVTGFVLMDAMPLRQIAVLLGLLGVAMAAGTLVAARLPKARLAAGLGASAVAAIAIVALAPALFHDIWERLLFKQKYRPGESFAHVIETKSGVITVGKEGTIYGGGAYDGAFSTDLVHDKNHIVRPYALSGLHPAPKQVLMVGLSSGSWAQVVAHNPHLEKLTVVEINPGYLDLISRYPEVRSLLSNPKVEIVVDDGRRWLLRHPDRRFDVVLQNTTWHWRSNITSLLSEEYMELVKAHLAPGGLFYFNTTHSPEAQRTAASKFAHGYRLMNFMAVSDAPLTFDKARWRETLLAYAIDGKKVFDAERPDDVRRLDEVLALPDRVGGKDGWLEPREEVLARTAGLPTITDDNMVNEWKHPLKH